MEPKTNQYTFCLRGNTAFFAFCFLLFAFPLKSQNPVVLHPIVGDTIDLIEKLDYLLFPEVPDSSFEQGVLIPRGQDFQLSVWYAGTISKFDITSVQFDMFAGNVEKLSAYYRHKAGTSETFSLGNSPLITRDSIPLGLNFEWMSKQQIQKMTKESRRYNKLKLEADEQGLMGYDRRKYIETGGRMEFPLSK